jgi:hypothetical protein
LTIHAKSNQFPFLFLLEIGSFDESPAERQLARSLQPKTMV